MVLVRPGERGPRVALIQILLNRAGNDLKVDGLFGPNTKAAVVRFQHTHGLAPDGIVGPRTWGKLPRGDNMKVVDVVDVGDPIVGRQAVSQLRTAGGAPIEMGLMCGGVEQMVGDVISQSGDRARIALLRIIGHGNLGRWMTVSVGNVVHASPQEQAVLATEYHSFIDWSHFDQLAAVLSGLRRYFAPYGMMEHGGCSLGSRQQTRNVLHRMADLWQVPVSVGIGVQRISLNFDGPVFTAYPMNGNLETWSKQFRDASF